LIYINPNTPTNNSKTPAAAAPIIKSDESFEVIWVCVGWSIKFNTEFEPKDVVPKAFPRLVPNDPSAIT